MSPEAHLSRDRRFRFALFFETGILGAIAVFSTFMSSPWTIERTATSPDASEATRKYVLMANVFNLAIGLFVSLVGGSLGPILGTSSGTGLMTIIYRYSRRQGLAQINGWDIAGFDRDEGGDDHHGGSRRR